MKVSVFGLGYVGTVSAACLATEGHDVTGVDVNPAKLAMIGEGRTRVVVNTHLQTLAEFTRRYAPSASDPQKARAAQLRTTGACAA